MDLNQLLADWIDPTILAIEDALNEGVYSPGPDPARHRRRPRPAPRELPQGHRRLPLAGRPGLRRRARADDLRQLPRPAGHRQRAAASPASAGPAPTSSPPSTASPSPTATSPPRASCAPSGWPARASRKVGLFWEQGSSGRDYADYFRDTAAQLGLTVIREVKLEPNPQGLQRRPGHDARPRHRGPLLRRLRLRHVPLRRGAEGARLGPAPGHGHRVHVLFELATSGPRASRAGTASTSSARTAPTPTTRR